MWGEEKKANYIKHATREYNIQRTLHHPRLVALNDVFEIDVNSFCTVLEYADGTDLDQLLKDQKVLSEKNARSIVSQVFSGLRCENYEFVLKTRNCVSKSHKNEEFCIKITHKRGIFVLTRIHFAKLFERAEALYHSLRSEAGEYPVFGRHSQDHRLRIVQAGRGGGQRTQIRLYLFPSVVSSGLFNRRIATRAITL